MSNFNLVSCTQWKNISARKARAKRHTQHYVRVLYAFFCPCLIFPSDTTKRSSSSHDFNGILALCAPLSSTSASVCMEATGLTVAEGAKLCYYPTGQRPYIAVTWYVSRSELLYEMAVNRLWPWHNMQCFFADGLLLLCHQGNISLLVPEFAVKLRFSNLFCSLLVFEKKVRDYQ